MMTLSEARDDALREIFNVGISQGAKQLSLLLHDEVEIVIPRVEILDADNIENSMGKKDDVLAVVSQSLQGSISGSALLVFQSDNSKRLASALIGSVSTIDSVNLGEFEHEAMTEIGNIIISSCVCAISKMLSNNIQFSVPNYTEQTPDSLGKYMDDIGPEKRDVACVSVQTEITAHKRGIQGQLMIILSLKSVDTLISELDKLLGR